MPERMQPDPLRPDLCRLAVLLEDRDVRLFVAGGYGLILKAEYLSEEGLGTRAPMVFPRATADLDVFLSAEVVADAAKMGAVQEALEELGYQPVEGRKNYQWSRRALVGSREVTVKIDLLGQIPENVDGVSIRTRRMRPKGFTGLHVHPAEEAEFIDEAALHVSACRDRGEGRVSVPHPFNYLLLKLYAFDDRKDDETLGFGRHHAFDGYRIVAMTTREEWREVRELRQKHAGNAVVARACEIVQGSFSHAEDLGALRLQEHAREAAVDLGPYPVPEFLEDLMALMLSD